MQFSICCALIAAFSSLSFAFAQLDVELGGDLEAAFGVAPLTGDFSVARVSSDLSLSGEVGTGFLPDAAFEATLISRYDAAQQDVSVGLGDTYATLYLGNFDLLVGQQTVTWGSTDVVSPTDVLSPADLSGGVVNARKLSAPMLRSIYNSPFGLKIDAVLLPVFQASVLPGLAPPPITPPDGTTVTRQNPPLFDLPKAELENVQIGLRTTYNADLMDGADLSATYIYGLSTIPTTSITFLPTEQKGKVIVQPTLRHDRYHLVGLDFSLAALGAVLRGEAAYTLTPNSAETDISEAAGRLDVVLGAETMLQDVTFIAQGVVNLKLADEMTPPTLGLSSTLSAFYDLDNRTSLRGVWLQNYSDSSGLASGGANYTFADGVKGAFQLTAYYGAPGSTWGAFRDLSELRLSLNYAF